MGGCERNGTVRQYIRSKVPRLRWTPDLHRTSFNAENGNLQMYRSMRNDFNNNHDDVEQSIGLFRKDSHEDQHDMCNYMHTSSQESCPSFIYHPLTVPSKRGRLETPGMHGYWERRIKGKEGIGDHNKWQQPLSFFLPHFHFNPLFTHQKEPDFLQLQVSKPKNGEHELFNKMESEKSEHVQDTVDEAGGLSLSLSLQRPFVDISNSSSNSEISDTHSMCNQSDQSSNKCSVNLDLSIALCL
ncbi:hypothetical protein E3N88_19641 [Mikania micrantha]|uniref:Uncharacterized protein n=1 Tax=Mikania micrantha TaxID=192012 RepID=A0A5N6NR70_9ASTR|nr:hypothetical protein E3N88_19641 [Mikania micrantha]